MNRWMLLATVFVSAMASVALLNSGFWEGNRAALLVALSVIAAGTLVRLARGLPFTNPDYYELNEIRKLTGAVSAIMSKLRLLLVIVISTMLLLVLAFPFAAFLARHIATGAQHWNQLASGILGAMHAYVFIRMYQVVLGDEDLTSLQSKYIERAVERRQAKKFSEAQEGEPSLSSSANYGKRLD